MKILFLHGFGATPGGTKPTFLKANGFEVCNPLLPNDDFDACVRIAQTEFDRQQPEVIVGSSRGGAVAINIDSGETPLVLLCPAWKRWGRATAVKPNTAILHAEADEAVPFAHSVELVQNSGLPASALIRTGTEHRLIDPDSLDSLLRAIDKLSGSSREERVMAEVKTGPKLGFFGPMKTLDSAQYGFEELPGGRFRAWIKHDTMKGVTPPILRWWFEHIDTFSSYNGQDFSGPLVPVYRFWHPFDHIAIRWAKRVHGPDGRLGPGSVIAIQENIAAKHPVRAKARVTKFDEEAFNFEPLLGGMLAVGRVVHEYAPVEDGVSFYTSVEIGITAPLIGPVLNWIIRKVAFSTEMFQDWILHNIEESGETEKFVPTLFAHAHAEE